MTSTLLRLPDKLKVGDKWYLKYPKTKEFAHFAQYHDRAVKNNDGFYIPAADGKLQGVVFVDSWAALNPEAKDEDEGNEALATSARMMSAGLKRFKGLMASKKVALVSTNQLSRIPMAMFGPKEDDKGGEALKYMSDVRTRHQKRSINSAPLWPVQSKKRPGFEVEPGVYGGTDAYSYVSVKTHKNKLLAPAGREIWQRIWLHDSRDGKAKGIDPVFDTIHYLFLTGQLIGGGQRARERMVLNLDKFGKTEKPISWADLKLWILGTRQEITEICRKYGFAKPFPIRQWAKKQVLSGRGDELYTALESAATKNSAQKQDATIELHNEEE